MREREREREREVPEAEVRTHHGKEKNAPADKQIKSPTHTHKLTIHYRAGRRKEKRNS